MIRHATFGRRAAAFIIDSIIVAVPTTIIRLAFYFNKYGISDAPRWMIDDQTNAYSPEALAMTLVSALITIVYFIVLENAWHATIGKRTMGLKVVREDGGPIAMEHVLKRNLLRCIWSIPMAGTPIALLDIILVALKKQRIGDIVAKTYVVCC